MQNISNNFIGACENEFTKEELEYFKTLRICVLTPIMEKPEGGTYKSVIDMVAYSWSKGLQIHEIGIMERVVVDWARNALARSAMKRESPIDGKLYTHFLWIDSDMIFSPDLACQLARHKKDMVSAVYYHRSGPPKPVAYVHLENDSDIYKHHQLIEIPPVLCKVDAVGFGVCLISRHVFEKTPEPWFTIDFRAGEDVAFCARAKEYGNQCWLDGQYTVGHIGLPPTVSKKDYEKWKLDNNDEFMGDRVPVTLI